MKLQELVQAMSSADMDLHYRLNPSSGMVESDAGIFAVLENQRLIFRALAVLLDQAKQKIATDLSNLGVIEHGRPCPDWDKLADSTVIDESFGVQL